MANTIDWGQAAINNSLGYGQAAKNNTLGFGESEATSWSGETNITGTPDTPPFSNTESILLDGIDAYVDCGNAFTSLTSFSVSAWFKSDDTSSSNQSIISSRINSIGTSKGVDIFINNNQLYSRIYNNGATEVVVAFTDTSGWHQVVLTYDGTTLEMYLDNVSKGTSTGAYSNSGANWLIGKWNNGSNYFNGNIDEVSVFNTELSQSDVTSIYNSGVPNDISSLSPLSWWRFEGTGTTATDSGSGGNNGTLENTVVRSTDVPTASSFTNTKSIALDGVDDFVEVSDNSNLSFGDGTTDSPFSISTWVKMTDATRFYVLSKGLVFSSNYEYLLNTNASDKLGLFLYDSSNNSRIGRLYNTPLTSYENQWIHICSTYNGSGLSSGIKVYLNGVRIDDTNSNSGTYVAMENGNRSLNIGRTETGLYSDGNIDETSLFNSELSQSDITSIYNGGEPNDISSLSLLSWWRCGDGDTAPTLTDNGSGGNDGTMTNFTTFSTDVPT